MRRNLFSWLTQPILTVVLIYPVTSSVSATRYFTLSSHIFICNTTKLCPDLLLSSLYATSLADDTQMYVSLSLLSTQFESTDVTLLTANSIICPF